MNGRILRISRSPGFRLASPVRTVLTLQMEAWLPVTGGLNKCRGVATKKVTFVSVMLPQVLP